MTNASTFDLVIMDTVMTLEKHYSDSQKKDYIPPVTEEELLKIKERV